MRRIKSIIKLAKRKNGKDFDKWIKSAPKDVADISEIRKITSKIDYSMSKASAHE